MWFLLWLTLPLSNTTRYSHGWEGRRCRTAAPATSQCQCAHQRRNDGLEYGDQSRPFCCCYRMLLIELSPMYEDRTRSLARSPPTESMFCWVSPSMDRSAPTFGLIGYREIRPLRASLRSIVRTNATLPPCV